MNEYTEGTEIIERPPKKKVGKAVVMGVIAVALIALAVVLTVVFTSGQTHELDGEYKLTGLGKGGVDYSSYIGQINYNYSITVNGSECTFEMQGYKTSAKIDQKKHTISSASIGTLEFTAEGNNITLNLSDYTMTFTRQ